MLFVGMISESKSAAAPPSTFVTEICKNPKTGRWIHLSSTANPTWGDIFELCFKTQNSKLECLFSLKRGQRDVRALSFELSKMSPQVGLAVNLKIYIRAKMEFSSFQNLFQETLELSKSMVNQSMY